MTKYNQVARQMVRDYPKLLKMVEENNGRMPGTKLGKLYGIDNAAARDLLIGIMAGRGDL